MGVCREFARRIIVCLAALLILAAIPVAAQLPTGTILGTVRDASGASIPGAMVTLRNTDTNLTKTATTEQDGSYRFPELPVGHYEIKAEAPGFRTETHTGLNLEVTQTGVINFALQVGATTQQVTVSSEIPLVNTQDSTLGGTVNEQEMSELPLNGRNYINLALYKPGVNQDRNQTNSGRGGQQGTSFSVNGATPRSNNFTLDGAVLQNGLGRNPVAGESGNALGLDGIKEYRVVTGTYQAEYGLAMGSEMVAVSKGGTNQFHGDVFEYFRNSSLDANDYFAAGAGVPIAPFQKNQFGAAFGGPIKKNKTFFYGVYEGVRQNLGVTSNNLVPAAGCHGSAGAVITLAACPDLNGILDSSGNQIQQVTLSPYTAPFLALAPLPNVPAPPGGGLAAYVFNDHNRLGENYGQMRVDQNFSASDTFFARYTIDNAVLNNTVGDYAYFREFLGARNQYVTLAEDHTFAPTVLNTARFSFSRTYFNTTENDVGLPNGTGPAIVSGFNTGVVDMNSTVSGTYAEFGSANAAPSTFQVQNIYTLSDDVNWTRGKHSFKFGTLLNRWNDGAQNTNSFNGQIQFNTFADFLQSNPFVVEFAPPFANENRFNIFNTAGFYGQDDWRVTRKLTLNLGLRYEFMTTPRELQGKQSRLINDYTDAFTIGPAIKNNTLHDFSPRVGFAYDPFGTGKTAIRGGAGIYYDIGNIGTGLEQNANGAPPFSAIVDILNTTTPSVVGWETTLGTCYTSPTCPGGNSTGFPFPIPQQVINSYNSPTNPTVLAKLTPQYMDYNFLSPYMIQYNVSVERQLPFDMALTVAYVGNHGVHLSSIRDGNPIFPTTLGPCGDPASLCVGGKVPFWDSSAASYTPVNPNIGSTINVATFADSKYNALQIALEKRTTHGLEFDASFTHSQTYDDTQGQSAVQDCSASATLQNTYPLAPRAVDWGPSCFNIPNNFEFTALYHFPNRMGGNGLAAKMLNGWFMSSIVTYQGGLPFSPIVGNNRSQSGVLQGQVDRANINTPALLAAYPCTSTPTQPATGPDTNPCAYTPIPYNANTVITGNINQWFNPNMFSISPQCLGPGLTNCSPTIGQLGTAGRNFLSGPPLKDWDFSIVKDTKVGFLGEAGMVEFRAEFFNVLNHPNFAEPGAQAFAGANGDLTPFVEAPSQGGGQITQMQGTPRQIQFAIRVEF